MQNQKMQVLLADAHNCSRIGLVQVLSDAGFEIVAEASSAAECLQLLAQRQPTLLLLACNLLPPEPMPFIETLRQAQPHGHMVLYLANCDDLPLPALLDAGVRGMVTNQEPTPMLVQVVQSAAAGQDAYSPQVLGKLLGTDSASASPLTEFEEKLLQLICAEKSNAEIAEIVTLNRKTVEKRLSAIYTKLGVKSRVGAALWFQRHQDPEGTPA